MCKRIRIHGDTRTDCYSWLQNARNKRVMRHLRRENEYTQRTLAPTAALQRTLYREMRARLVEDDVSAPVKRGPYHYYTRTKKGKQYAIHCRKKGVRGKEEVVLDENKLARGTAYFSLGAFAVDPTHSLLAYTTDTEGNELYRLHIKDLATGRVLETINASVGSVAWVNGGSALLYTRERHPFPPHEVLLHTLGDDPADDTLVYTEHDPNWAVQLSASNSEHFVFIESGTFRESEVRVLPATFDTLPTPTLMAKRTKGVHYYAEHWGEYFYIVSKEGAVNYEILRTPVTMPHKKHWRRWLRHSRSRSIDGIAAFASFLVVGLRVNGSPELAIYTHDRRAHTIALPEAEHAVSLAGLPDYTSDTFAFVYTSFLTPPRTYTYTPHTRTLRIKKRKKVPGYRADRYTSRRIWVSHDGVRIPVELWHRRDTTLDGSAPTLLTAYGSYGISIDPSFSIDKLSLVDRGWVIALAHPRGGGELGEWWHKQAYLLTKKKTAEDFIAVAHHLATTITTPDKLAISGGSAGGMLMGMVLNEAPTCCGAALVYVPAADVLTSMSDPTLPGTKIHYSEVGDPHIKRHYEYLKSYCPYHNVRHLDYPPVLVRASLHDIRTPYWEAAKWVARLREYATHPERILLLTELSAGHFGKSGRYEWLKNRALDYAFLLHTIPARQRPRG